MKSTVIQETFTVHNYSANLLSNRRQSKSDQMNELQARVLELEIELQRQKAAEEKQLDNVDKWGYNFNSDWLF